MVFQTERQCFYPYKYRFGPWRSEERRRWTGKEGTRGSHVPRGKPFPRQKKKLIKGIPPGIAGSYIASALDWIKSKSTDHDQSKCQYQSSPLVKWLLIKLTSQYLLSSVTTGMWIYLFASATKLCQKELTNNKRCTWRREFSRLWKWQLDLKSYVLISQSQKKLGTAMRQILSQYKSFYAWNQQMDSRIG